MCRLSEILYVATEPAARHSSRVAWSNSAWPWYVTLCNIVGGTVKLRLAVVRHPVLCKVERPNFVWPWFVHYKFQERSV
ncbi:MAG: hypothetical protein JXB42_06630 [Deltaproteobacteria bacterium]|nr:hypothetical protein [Deltaproteobacteria bacterium]